MAKLSQIKLGSTTYDIGAAWSNISSKPDYYDAKAIKGITRSGNTFTYTCMDGTTGTFTQKDNNTTYTFTNGNPTLSWNTKSTIGTAGGVDFTATMPSNPTIQAFDRETSNYKDGIVFYQSDGATRQSYIGFWNTNGIILNPSYNSTGNTTNPWTTSEGLCVGATSLTFNGSSVLTASSSNYIKSLSISGKTITYTKGDGTTGTLTTQDNNTTYSAGTGLSLSGTKFNHSNSVTAGSVGSAQSPAHGETFAIPKITYDAQGHITEATTVNITLPADNNTDTKVKQGRSTSGSWRPLLSHATASAFGTDPGTKTDQVYYNESIAMQPSTGTIKATKFDGVSSRSQYLETWYNEKDKTYGTSYPLYAWWETGSECRLMVDNYTVKVNYADSAGTCTSLSTNAGSTTKAIYFSGGKPAQCNDTLNHNISGNAATATKLATAQTISLTGDVTGSASFTGNTACTITATVADNSHNHNTVTSSGTKTMITGTAQWPAGFTVGNIYQSGYPFSYGSTWMYQGSFGAELIFNGLGGDGNTGTGHMYFRTRSDWATSNWGDWKKLWCTGDAVTGAVWNDYAECRASDCEEPGRVLIENGDDTLSISTERLQQFAGISSDTWGFSQGETEKAKTHIAVAGRVLAYPYQNRDNYKPGDCVCTAPGGTVDIMTEEEIIRYPHRIVGIVSCVPDYEEWGGGEKADRDPVKVNGRIWIKVK